jgi:hypothetical protein
MQPPPPAGTTGNAPPPPARSPGAGAGVSPDKSRVALVSDDTPAAAPHPIDKARAIAPPPSAIAVVLLFITTPNCLPSR